jgi:uncharacterized membrane protein YhaH (DUF805 family)/uncharacterized protein YndB with AHSA1/START domain
MKFADWPSHWSRVLRFRESVGRLAFFLGLLSCLVVKQGLDRWVLEWLGVPYSGRIWSILLGVALPTEEDLDWGWPLLATSLPFVWIGLALTAGRLRALHRSAAWALLFFVPVVKFILVLLLLALPDNTAPVITADRLPPVWFRWIPRNRWGSASLGAVLTALLGALSVFLIANYLEAYGWALFVALPFLMGFLTTLIHNHHELRSLRESCLCSVAALGLLGGVLIMMAIEGLICLLMASPIAVVLALIGSFMAYTLISQRWGRRLQDGCVYSAAFLLLPMVTALERATPAVPEVRPVTTEVTIAAPPQTVWWHVVSFADLPAPTEWLFRTGIAYPIRARLEGRGVGAVRYCEFSTGPFVEPIEVWDEPRRLAFAVTDYPAPMEEWTPYAHIHPPHLDGFLVSKRGQFELFPTVDGGTRLVGTTWYQHGLLPDRYWRLWSDAILHRIHSRVLGHIRNLAEADRLRP